MEERKLGEESGQGKVWSLREVKVSKNHFEEEKDH